VSKAEDLFSSAKFNESNSIYLESLGKNYGTLTLGLNTTRIFNEDPKLALFTLSRYKFVAKMLSGDTSVLEIGCQEGFGARIVTQEIPNYVGIDFYKPYVSFSISNALREGVNYREHDILDGHVRDQNGHRFDSAFALDVLEHIHPSDEDLFLRNVLDSVDEYKAKLIIGMPSLESQVYASEASKKGHVNCKTASSLKHLLSNYFNHVFIFSMNDEVLHTGFHSMSHYIFALAVAPKARSRSQV